MTQGDTIATRSRTASLAAALALVVAAVLALPARADASATWKSGYDWPGGHGYAGWEIDRATDDPAAYGVQTNLGGRPGAWLWLAGGREYRPGSAAWRLRAPGTTRIRSGRVHLRLVNKLFAHHCVRTGLDAAAGTAGAERLCSPPEREPEDARWTVNLDDGRDEPASKEVSVRVDMPVCNNPAAKPCSKWIPILDPLKNGASVLVEAVDLTLADDDLPTVIPSGPFRELDGRYVNGRETHDLVVDAADVGAGVARVGFDWVGHGEEAHADAACDPAHRTETLGARICPPSTRHVLVADARRWPEGEHRFAATARDFAGNAHQTPAWAVRVDRTGPGAAQQFGTDFDEETGEAEVSWIAGADPALADGIAGSGTLTQTYRYRRDGGDWSAWQLADGPGFDLTGARVGETVGVEVRAWDAVGNEGALATAELVISAARACPDDIERPDAIGAATHLQSLGDEVVIDSFTFTTPQSPQRIAEALPAGAQVAGLAERTTASPGDVHTGGMTPAPGQSLAEAMELYEAGMRNEIRLLRDDLAAEREDASATDRALVDAELDRIEAREDVYDRNDGVPVKSVAIEHDPAAAAALRQEFAGQIETAETATSDSSEVCEEAQVMQARRMLAAASTADSSSGDSSGPEEKNWRPNSYSPQRMRITAKSVERRSTTTGKVRKWNEVLVAWRFRSTRNRAYWLRGNRKNDMDRGYEVEARLDEETSPSDGPFGYPVWNAKPAFTDAQLRERGIPNIWGANFRCPYLDDYFGDNLKAGYRLTVGSMCRPASNTRRYSWYHDLIPGDPHDRVVGTVSPVHIAQDHRAGVSTELRYCQFRSRDGFAPPGSCMFSDHGVPSRTFNYDGDADGKTQLVTPGSKVFHRAPL